MKIGLKNRVVWETEGKIRAFDWGERNDFWFELSGGSRFEGLRNQDPTIHLTLFYPAVKNMHPHPTPVDTLWLLNYLHPIQSRNFSSRVEWFKLLHYSVSPGCTLNWVSRHAIKMTVALLGSLGKQSVFSKCCNYSYCLFFKAFHLTSEKLVLALYVTTLTTSSFGM